MKSSNYYESVFKSSVCTAAEIINPGYDDEVAAKVLNIHLMRDKTLGEIIVSGRGLSGIEVEVIQKAAMFRCIADLTVHEIAEGRCKLTESEIELLKSIVAGLKPYEPDDEEEVD